MKTAVSTAVLGLAAVANAKTLTAEVAGKTVFIKFQAPWWGHCKKMKPDWEKLEAEFDSSTTQLIGDVDCTADGKPLCEANGVRGYPTLKWGDPTDLQDYQGGRDYDTLKSFAEENLKPICSPSNIDLCAEDKKAEIKKFQAMSAEELDKAIKEKEAEQEKAEADFKTYVEQLQAQYREAMEAKDAAVEAVKNSGLGLMKAVKASMDTAKDEL